MENKELQNLEDIAQFAKEDGGKHIIESTKSIVVSTVEILANGYQEKSRDELVSLCARLQAHLSLYQLLTGIDDQIEQIKKLFEK